MKIAITSTGDKSCAKLDRRFGRCSYFAIYDTDNKSTVFVENPNKEAPEGAGPASVQLVASQGVEQIISGEFGGKVKSILDELQIQMVILNEQEKTIEDILQQIGKN